MGKNYPLGECLIPKLLLTSMIFPDYLGIGFGE